MEIVLEPMDPEHWPATVDGRSWGASDAKRWPTTRSGGPSSWGTASRWRSTRPRSTRRSTRRRGRSIRLWPGGWAAPLCDVFQLDRRAVTPSRVAKKESRPPRPARPRELAEGDDADSRGYLLVALARYVDRYSYPRQGLQDSVEDVRRTWTPACPR